MAYTVRDAAGVVVAGDDELDDVMKAAALLIGGSVVDESTGETVYAAKPIPTAEKLAAQVVLPDPDDAPEVVDLTEESDDASPR